MMTPREHAYYDTLNLFGSDVEPPEIQALIDKEHAAADPKFAAQLKLIEVIDTAKQLRFTTSLNPACGHFDTDVERDLYRLAALCWNQLQGLIKAAEAATR